MDLTLHSKDDYRRCMLDLLEPLRPYYSEGGARLSLGVTMAHYDIGATWMEAFSRPLWALVPFWAGGGKAPEFEDLYRRGLVSGTDPDGPEYWGGCTSFDQRFVEMAAISYGLLFAPEVVWDPFSPAEQEHLVRYLNQINEHPLPVCNWILFAVLVNIALAKLDQPYHPEMLAQYLDGLETFYLGNGWYQDGDSGQKDYYISFAIHFYCLIYSAVMGDRDPARAATYKDRAMTFARQFIYWFDETGEALPFGRSLTYRFAQVSMYSACLLAGIEPFPVPVMKGLIARHLRNWLQRPILDRDGVLTIGYGYPNLIMAERYNAPGSPYWGMKVFAFLMLPDDHPFWSAEEAPYPALPAACPMREADLYLYHHGSHVTAYAPGVYSPSGHGQTAAKYGKFAYDTRFSISVSKSSYELHENAPDSMLAFVIDGYVYVRRICEAHEITDTGVVSRWSPYPGIEVVTTLTPDAGGHTRVHEIHSSVACEAYDCGYAVNRGDQTDVGFHAEVHAERATAANDDSACTVSAVAIDTQSAVTPEGYLITADPNTNLLYPKTMIPAVHYSIHEGTQTLRTRVDVTVR